MERQLEDTVGGVVAHEAVGHDAAGESNEGHSTRADDDLADPKRVVHGSGRCLKGEPLVVVIVAADDQLRTGVVKGLPQRGGQPVGR